jgi:hypothetical protein
VPHPPDVLGALPGVPADAVACPCPPCVEKDGDGVVTGINVEKADGFVRIVDCPSSSSSSGSPASSLSSSSISIISLGSRSSSSRSRISVLGCGINYQVEMPADLVYTVTRQLVSEDFPCNAWPTGSTVLFTYDQTIRHYNGPFGEGVDAYVTYYIWRAVSVVPPLACMIGAAPCECCPLFYTVRVDSHVTAGVENVHTVYAGLRYATHIDPTGGGPFFDPFPVCPPNPDGSFNSLATGLTAFPCGNYGGPNPFTAEVIYAAEHTMRVTQFIANVYRCCPAFGNPNPAFQAGVGGFVTPA